MPRRTWRSSWRLVRVDEPAAPASLELMDVPAARSLPAWSGSTCTRSPPSPLAPTDMWPEARNASAPYFFAPSGRVRRPSGPGCGWLGPRQDRARRGARLGVWRAGPSAGDEPVDVRLPQAFEL